jgi:signal peptidase I
MSETESPKSSKWIVYLIEGSILVLAVVLVLAIRFGVYDRALVMSRSMQPTLRVDDSLLIDHRDSLRGTWRRGDIVLFTAPDSWMADSERSLPTEDRERLIKRVVGLPGERVDVQGAQIWINSRPLQESYATPAVTGARPAPAYTWTLGSNQYFVTGDNRGNSEDSRMLGPISDDDIIGRAVRIVWPPARSGPLPLPDYKQS